MVRDWAAAGLLPPNPNERAGADEVGCNAGAATVGCAPSPNDDKLGVTTALAVAGAPKENPEAGADGVAVKLKAGGGAPAGVD